MSPFQFLCIALALNCALAAHLGNTYIPPPAHAGSAGGSNFLTTPNRGGSNFASTSHHQFASNSGHGASAGGAYTGTAQFSGNQQNYQQQQGGYQQQHQQQSSYNQQSSGQQIPIIKFENQPHAGDGTYSYS